MHHVHIVQHFSLFGRRLGLLATRITGGGGMVSRKKFEFSTNLPQTKRHVYHSRYKFFERLRSVPVVCSAHDAEMPSFVSFVTVS